MLVAIDRSTSVGSAALFSPDGGLVATVSDSRAGHGDAYGLFNRLLCESCVTIDAISRFATGIGPGSFSGIRAAIAVLSGLALPEDGVVEGVSSAAAANAVFRDLHPDVESVAVVGDARRGHLWVAVFNSTTEPRNNNDDFTLVDRDAVVSAVPAYAAVITPDFNRIGDLLVTAFSEDRVFSVLPTAEAVGRLALAGCSAVALPIYLHAAVG